MEFLQAIEGSGFSMYIKESSTAYTMILAYHTIGLAFLVGISGGLALRVLGVAPNLPLEPLQDFFPLMWLGLGINAVTGGLLLVLYPTKYFVDWSFYLKMAAVIASLFLVRKLIAQLYGATDPETAARSENTRRTASILIAAWLVAITTGRVTAYTTPTKVQTAAAVFVFMMLLLLVRRFARSRGWLGSPTRSA